MHAAVVTVKFLQYGRPCENYLKHGL